MKCLSLSLLAAVSFASLALAGPKVATSACGSAAVEVVGIPDRDGGYEKVTITAKTPTKETRLEFEGRTLRGEYFHATCLEGKNEHKYIVFQNYCGGSACRDLDNYGIIDSETLKVLLLPDDTNRTKAAQILGIDPPPLFRDKKKFF